MPGSSAVTAEDCRSCGVCCITLRRDQEAFCDVEAADLVRLDKRWARKNVMSFSHFDQLLAAIDGDPNMPGMALKTKWERTKAGPFKNVSVNKCVALRGSVMHRTSCSIYERRPNVCREAVKPGDQTCRWLRKEMKRLEKAMHAGQQQR